MGFTVRALRRDCCAIFHMDSVRYYQDDVATRLYAWLATVRSITQSAAAEPEKPPPITAPVRGHVLSVLLKLEGVEPRPRC